MDSGGPFGEHRFHIGDSDELEGDVIADSARNAEEKRHIQTFPVDAALVPACAYPQQRYEEGVSMVKVPRSGLLAPASLDLE
mgnify:FL=1